MPDPGATGRGRRIGAALVALGLPLLLAGCGDDEASSAQPDLPSETPALWNPCDTLDAAFIQEQFGIRTTERNGTATEPDCRFAPAGDSGDPVVSVNYQLFDGDLDQLWDAMGQQDTADVREPEIEGADAARVVVDARKKQLYVTGFVETGDLFQVVNVVDPKPYDVDAVVAAVEATLTAVAGHANDAGIGVEQPADDASPTPSS
ncbi:hypothetical protein [Nocardioides sambongensis]|uniref:hypothetical protein n=1 Tax=Nocardioides sambongensis TaxID=2589074 RepID=UPI0015E870E5|nr:hypothetical protein [Nocardioides sambongensis]